MSATTWSSNVAVAGVQWMWRSAPSWSVTDGVMWIPESCALIQETVGLRLGSGSPSNVSAIDPTRDSTRSIDAADAQRHG
jgi:hypothetical protein